MQQLELFKFESVRSDPLQQAQDILTASDELEPFARVLMFSGGKDSMAILEACRVLGVTLDAILHVNTGCGVPETTEWVRSFVETPGIPYIEASSGNAYADYVRRKGFFGVGTGLNSAHSFAFHVCKRAAYTHALADLRGRKRGRRIILINGARVAESKNRDKNMRGKYIKCDQSSHGKPSSPNWWVSPLLNWSNNDRNTFLAEQKCPINPVSKALCRSGECMCGTVQGQAARVEASAYSPRFKAFLDPLDEYAKQRFGFGWGESEPVSESEREQKFQRQLEDKGQLRLLDDSPLCSSCRADSVEVG